MRLIAFAAVAMWCAPALAQVRDANNSVFLEAGGPGLYYSLNYERIFDDDLGIRLGFSYRPLSAAVASGGSSASPGLITLPILANWLLSYGTSTVEIGGGATLVRADGAGSANGLAVSGPGTTVLWTGTLGYRRQPMDGGFQFRVGIEALVGKGLGVNNPDPNQWGILPWAYVSFGFSM
jgi:hypothetical protein